MKRLRVLFAAILLLLALPFWRFADMVAIASPFDWPLTFALTIWFALFVGIPFKLIFKQFKIVYLLLTIAAFGSIAWWSSPLSGMATNEPDFNHCGSITYTGTFYPIRTILSDAHRDDLEARNQLCWVRKMISKVPRRFDSMSDIHLYTKLIQDRLLKPEIKFRSSLPLIAVLYFTINASAVHMVGVKEIYDSLHFWIDHYTDEISSRQYSAWNWPHSSYIQFEYGLVEKNWQELIDNIVIEEN